MNTLLAPLAQTLSSNLPEFKSAELERAFEVASGAHAGQVRKSGEPYITHPVLPLVAEDCYYGFNTKFFL